MSDTTQNLTTQNLMEPMSPEETEDQIEFLDPPKDSVAGRGLLLRAYRALAAVTQPGAKLPDLQEARLAADAIHDYLRIDVSLADGPGRR